MTTWFDKLFEGIPFRYAMNVISTPSYEGSSNRAYSFAIRMTWDNIVAQYLVTRDLKISTATSSRLLCLTANNP